jgi:hypothetical protein
MEITTIKLSKETKKRLNKLKTHNRESYEEILKKILNILNICKNNPIKAKEKLSDIEKIKRIKN